MESLHSGNTKRQKVRRKLSKRSLLVWAGILFIFAAACPAILLIANNNCDRWSDEYFQSRLEASITASEKWVKENSSSILQTRNAAVIKMLDRCNEIHADPDIGKIVDSFVHLPVFHYSRCWIAEVDPNYPIVNWEINKLFSEQPIDYKWTLYVLAPDQIDVTSEELEIFNPEKWQGRNLTHQLWALILLSERQSAGTNVSSLIEHLSERLSKELFWDIAVVDIYIQKVAFILSAGYPEKINRRWIQRIIKNQNSDGGWNDRWLCLTSGRRPVFSKAPPSDQHATIQALYALYMARYQYQQHFGIDSSQNDPATASSD